MEAFVYRWDDKFLNKSYIGVHKGSPEDGYICSSKSMLFEYHKRPYDFQRTIISEHATYEEAIASESILLKSVDARNNLAYYNLHNGDGKFKSSSPTLETRRKISEAQKGKPRGSSWNAGKKLSPEHKQKLSQARIGKKPWNKGLPMSEETKQKVSINRKGITAGKLNPFYGKSHTTETKQKLKLAHTGKKLSIKTKQRMSVAQSRRRQLEKQNAD